MTTTLPDTIDQLVFSGGGLRCFWQGGFLEELGKTRRLRPQRVTGVSGGALAASTWISGTERRLLDRMCRAFEEQDSNLDLFARNEDGITPHQEMYCRVVSNVIDDTAARALAKDGLADQAPMPDPDEGETPVLLTRRYDRLPEVEGRRYVWPSEKTPADKIDFTDPGKLRRTWKQGTADARKWLCE